ncbi:PREDICTED: filaggrin-2-like [Branchiostoma belcheri]|uniref:Filaggrin-2-like n=1 Tax=Branchiostoma belcheri TaxID=7741 RepID=A0A6P4ZS42_BRABE|nr:PREDICTED: filaggrin-2-like [Branchiostoma belcheri]
MGRKLRHVLIFLLVILKESNMPEAYCGCKPSSLCKENLGLTSIPQNLPTSISGLDLGIIVIVLIGTILVTVWYKRRTRHPPLGPNPGVVGSNTNTAVSVMSSGHQRRQGHSQANIQSLTVGNLSNVQVMAALKQNAGYVGVGTAPTEQAYTEMASGHNQTGQGQSQATTEFNTNTTTVMTNGDDHQYEDIDNHRVEAGQGQSQVITESNTNTTAIVMTSGHDQTGQGQSQVITESNTNTTATVMTSGHDQTGQGQSQVITESNTNATAAVMTSGHDQTGQGQSQVITESNTNTTATVMTSGHDQTGQGQSQVITESNTNTTATVMTSGHDQIGQGQYQPLIKSNTNTTATVMTSGHDQTGQGQSQVITESNTNTTATVMTSGHDQTGKGQSQAIVESLDAENLSYGTGLTTSQLNSQYGNHKPNTTATVMTSRHDQTLKGQSQAIPESLDAENLSYGTGLTVSQLNSQYGYHN